MHPQIEMLRILAFAEGIDMGCQLTMMQYEKKIGRLDSLLIESKETLNEAIKYIDEQERIINTLNNQLVSVNH